MVYVLFVYFNIMKNVADRRDPWLSFFAAALRNIHSSDRTQSNRTVHAIVISQICAANGAQNKVPDPHYRQWIKSLKRQQAQGFQNTLPTAWIVFVICSGCKLLR
jgi:hypothetical protein